jgi:phosphoglycerate-specific signal transduction histidine kinase
LRRNGSWKQGINKNVTKENFSEKKELDNEFLLDEKFGILAAEIKKRMEQKATSTNNNNSNNINSESSTRVKNLGLDDNFNKLKKQLLPHLTEVEQLVHEREMYVKKIYKVDDKLDSIKSEILIVKERYQKDLDNMQKNIDFFNESLQVIESIREKK